MRGFFVATVDPVTDDDKRLVDSLKQRGFVHLKDTRAFNYATSGQFTQAAKSATRKLRMNTPEQIQKRKEYNARKDVKEKTKLRHRLPEVKEQRRKYRERQKKLLAAVPLEVRQKIYQEEQKEIDEKSKHDTPNKDDDDDHSEEI
jgi:hypothetical protein